jgi:hypothetical protein
METRDGHPVPKNASNSKHWQLPNYQQLIHKNHKPTAIKTTIAESPHKKALQQTIGNQN